MNETPSQPEYGESWQDILAGPLPPAPVEQPAAVPKARRLARAGALAMVGLLAGVIGVNALQAATRTSPSPVTVAGTAATQGGDSAGSRGFADGRGGGFPGEQRLVGTLTAVGSSSVTVQSDDGTSTYAVSSATDVERDGQPVALSALKVGDVVLVHVLPSGSGFLAERVLAGASSASST